MLKTRSDEELLDAFVKSNDEQAFRCVVERYSGLIYNTALRSLNDRTLAEDVICRQGFERYRRDISGAV